MRRCVRRGKASGNKSFGKEEIVEQQVNIGSLHFRNEKTLFVDVILAFLSPFESGSGRKKLRGGRETSQNQQGFYIYYYFHLGLRWNSGRRKFVRGFREAIAVKISMSQFMDFSKTFPRNERQTSSGNFLIEMKVNKVNSAYLSLIYEGQIIDSGGSRSFL